MKIVRCDREIEMPRVDRTLQAWGHTLTLLPECVSESELAATLAGSDLLLMCYTPIPGRVSDRRRGCEAL